MGWDIDRHQSFFRDQGSGCVIFRDQNFSSFWDQGPEFREEKMVLMMKKYTSF